MKLVRSSQSVAMSSSLGANGLVALAKLMVVCLERKVQARLLDGADARHQSTSPYASAERLDPA
jgi:hypothetical protein